VIEAAVAVLLFPRMLLAGVPVLDALWESVYLSAMAFTNTGFVPTPEGLDPYAADPYFLTVLMIGVFLGAIGFPVIFVLAKHLLHPKRWSLHVKLTLLTSLLLLFGGAVAYFGLEFDNERTMGGMDFGQRVLQSFFISSM